MPLPAPQLDDRRFQELVDEAKRTVQQRCPEWTDHNVSDPGVTLIELFAWMTDVLLYRLNRVPDRNYVKFLELLGVQLYPATAARTGVTFWLSAPQDRAVTVPVGTVTATEATGIDDEVTFTTVEEVRIVPCSLQAVMTGTEDGEPYDESQVLSGGEAFHCFQEPPEPGDHVLFGLSDPVPSCVLSLRLDCEIEGVGVDPDDPPLVWEAWDGERWVVCDVERDDTGGLNRPGDILIHVPADHSSSLIAEQAAGWIRCRATTPAGDQSPYSSPPRILAAEAVTIGGTATSVNARLVEEEVLGTSDGTPGQRFELQHRPVIPGPGPIVVEVGADDGWEAWEQIEDFSESGPDDRHFRLDAVAGEIALGPAVREADGTVRRYGAVPPQGATLQVEAYRTGGGHQGNVSARTIRVMRSSLPLISDVSNLYPAVGGVDSEPLENAKLRGPMLLRSRNRAVTVEDYELLAREAAPEVSRVRCVPAGDGGTDGVRVLVVPHVESPEGRLAFEQLVPTDETLQRIAAYLDDRRPVGSRAVVEPPAYQGVTVVARLRARPEAASEQLREEALTALYRYLHPQLGGPDGQGWPFGRRVHVGEVYAVLQRLSGTELVEEARLFTADPVSGERGEPTERIDVGSNELVFSYEHQVRVESH